MYRVFINRERYRQTVLNAPKNNGAITGQINDGLIHAFVPGTLIGVWHLRGSKPNADDRNIPVRMSIRINGSKIYSRTYVHGEKIPAQSINIVNFSKEITSRHKELMDIENIQKAIVLVIGVGAIGSLFSVEITRMGTNNFIVIDKDVVEPANLSRTAYVFSDVGREKVEAIRDRIRDVNPNALVDFHNRDVHDITDSEWIDIVKTADICLIAADDVMVQVKVSNRLSNHMPVIVSNVVDQGNYGEITIVTKDTKNFCCLTNVKERMNHAPKGVSGAQGLVTDYSVIASEIVNIVCHLLQPKTSSRFPRQLEASKNLILVGRGDITSPIQTNLKSDSPLGSLAVDTSRTKSSCSYCEIK